PGSTLNGSFGQRSLQSAVPSPSVSVSTTPQPHAPGSSLFGSVGQPSRTDSEKGDADEDEAREADPLARGSGEIPHPRHDRSGHED
ncbi:MAG: hypothetical protein ACO4BV_10615, partial [Ilumatobacteraceae bacterium]